MKGNRRIEGKEGNEGDDEEYGGLESVSLRYHTVIQIRCMLSSFINTVYVKVKHPSCSCKDKTKTPNLG